MNASSDLKEDPHTGGWSGGERLGRSDSGSPPPLDTQRLARPAPGSICQHKLEKCVYCDYGIRVGTAPPLLDTATAGWALTRLALTRLPRPKHNWA